MCSCHPNVPWLVWERHCPGSFVKVDLTVDCVFSYQDVEHITHPLMAWDDVHTDVSAVLLVKILPL